MQIAYLMTHYPRVALTFISGEIDTMERAGAAILPIALNLPDAADVKSDEAIARQDRTHYLKSSVWQLALAVLRTSIAHPLVMGQILWLAVKSARWDISLIIRRLAHLCYACRTAQLCSAHSIRHLHAHFGQTPATIAWFTCEILNRTTTRKTSWSFTIHGFQDFVDDTVARLDLKAASAAFIICISDYTKSQLCRVTDPKYWDRFHVARCGIDLKAFPFRISQPERAVLRIILVARLSPEKGHLVLLRAIKMLRDEGIGMELQIVGAGPFEESIRCEEARLGLGGLITYTGELPPADVSKLLADADIFCLPSFSEGLPVSIMEAMAIGVPVVSTWISGIPELAINGIAALTVPASNAPALASALKKLANDRQLRTTLARNARAEVERMHDLQPNAAKLFSMFQSVLNSGAVIPPPNATNPAK
jgi:glycosyltransferase involved in cell wall biosynthesis